MNPGHEAQWAHSAAARARSGRPTTTSASMPLDALVNPWLAHATDTPESRWRARLRPRSSTPSTPAAYLDPASVYTVHSVLCGENLPPATSCADEFVWLLSHQPHSGHGHQYSSLLPSLGPNARLHLAAHQGVAIQIDTARDRAAQAVVDTTNAKLARVPLTWAPTPGIVPTTWAHTPARHDTNLPPSPYRRDQTIVIPPHCPTWIHHPQRDTGWKPRLTRASQTVNIDRVIAPTPARITGITDTSPGEYSIAPSVPARLMWIDKGARTLVLVLAQHVTAQSTGLTRTVPSPHPDAPAGWS